MANRNKEKGKSWERDVCKFLTETYGVNFQRVWSSGAFVGGSNAQRKQSMSANQIQASKGDIHTPDGWGKLVIECKSYNNFLFHHLFLQENKMLDTWISQVREAEDSGDVNLIIIKIARMGQYVCYEKSSTELKSDFGINYKEWVFCEWADFWHNNVDALKKISTT